MSKPPIDKLNIGYNKTNEQYLELLEEKNKIVKGIEKTKEHQEKKKIQEREQGFNIYLSGANEERIKEQRKSELMKERANSITDKGDKGARRMWRNPSNDVKEDNEEQPQPAKYHNPFDLNYGQPVGSHHQGLSQSPAKVRKRWGELQTNVELNVKEVQIEKNKEDDDDYSADSFDDNQILEDQNEEFEEEVKDIEQFLMTATLQDLNDLKQSLSFKDNKEFAKFAQDQKNKEKHKQDDDYIEEDFEEDIPEVDEEDDNSEEETKQEQSLQQSKVISTAKGKTARMRPISATYSLAQPKVQQKIEQTYGKKDGYSSAQQVSEVQRTIITQPNQMQKYDQDVIQDTPKQPNDMMKKPINTNPFKRPFSQNLPQRAMNNVQNAPITSQMGSSTIKDNQYQTNPNQFRSNTQKGGIDSLLSRIGNLDETQREKLVEVLNKLEETNQQSSSSLSQSQNKQLQIKPETLDLKKILSPPKEQGKTQQSRARNELIIRVLCTYGNPHLCGLTEIELFNEHGNKIPLMPSCILIRNLGKGSKYQVEKLINGTKLTTDDKQMWIGYLPKPPDTLEIVIYYHKDTQVGGIKIWNYNKSIQDYVKGVKDIEVFINDKKIWSGRVKGGKGKSDEDYSTMIPLIEGMILPLEPVTAKSESFQQAISEAIEDEEESKLDIAQQNTKALKQEDLQDEMKKYRSEAQIKPMVNSKPLWLADKVQPSSQLNQITDRDQQKSQQQQKRARNQQSEVGSNTADLLSKYAIPASTKDNSSQQSSISSEVISQIGKYPDQKPSSQIGSSRQYDSRIIDNSQSSGNLIKPNVGLGGLSKNTNFTKPFDIQQSSYDSKRQSNTQQVLSGVKKEQMEDASQAILKAVSKVNQVVSQGQQQNQQQKVLKFREKNKLVEESLDSLDFFKVTNLGRLVSGAEKVQGLQDSPQKGLQDSQNTKRSAHVVVKNPFPEKSASKNQVQTQRKVQFNQEEDTLDQFLKYGSEVGSKVKTQRENIDIPIFSEQIKSSNVVSQLQQKGSHLSSQFPISQEQVFSKNKEEVLPVSNANQQDSYEAKLRSFTDMFIIPNLPSGQKLQFNILSTWGDMNYVGLAGIEIFDIEGRQIKVEDANIVACPPDVNILPGYGGDPRTVEKLVDGHYFTNDDLHVWLTPFTAGDDHTISIDFGKKCQLSMIRIWNYNKSRIHSYRGARLITCELDKRLIFKGEIQKAPGTLSDPEGCCEILLFTDNDAILQRIDQNDWINGTNISSTIQASELENTQKMMKEGTSIPHSMFDDRPMTATKKFNTQEIDEIQRQLKQQKPTSIFDDRPQTSAIMPGDNLKNKLEQKSKQLGLQQNKVQTTDYASSNSQNRPTAIKAKVIEMNITETWGDLFYVGLNGIEVLDEKGKVIPIQISKVDANPRDMNSIPGYGSDYRTLDKLFDSVNNTMDDHHMWLIPFNKGENHSITIDLGRTTFISAIRFYNYNKSDEDTLRGAKQVTILIDYKPVTPKKGVTLRKGPGIVHPLLDLGQTIELPYHYGWSSDQIIPIQKPFHDIGLFQEYEPINMPMGFLFKFNLYSTHGDFYYIGLTGIELYDQQGQIIKCNKIIAEPEGVLKLQGMENDIRTADKLIDGKNQTYDDSHMWLAPFKNTKSQQAAGASKDGVVNAELRAPNFVYILFDQPVSISAIRIWNYSKTPSRGVNEFELLVDDKQVYRGFAKKAPEKQEWDKSFNKDFSSIVLFTSDQKIIERFKLNINYDPSKQQSVLLTNEGKQMNRDQVRARPDEKHHKFNELERPKTMVMRD